MNKTIFYSTAMAALVLSCQYSYSASDLDLSINKHQQKFEDIALQIWEIAEMGYQEYRSSNLLKEALSEEGFRIQNNVANIPTAFIAEYGSGFPVIAILGEFDALPGISQSASPFKEKYKDNIAGHACGHHLFGAGLERGALP